MIITIANICTTMATADKRFQDLHKVLEHLMRDLNNQSFNPTRAYIAVSRVLSQLRALCDTTNGWIMYLPMESYYLQTRIKNSPNDIRAIEAQTRKGQN